MLKPELEKLLMLTLLGAHTVEHAGEFSDAPRRSRAVLVKPAPARKRAVAVQSTPAPKRAGLAKTAAATRRAQAVVARGAAVVKATRTKK